LQDLDKIKRALETSPLIDTRIIGPDGKVIEDDDEKGKGFANQRCYHAITRGLTAQQILRTVDPKKRSFGQFVKEEILDPLNKNLPAGVDKAEHWIGLPKEHHDRVATLIDMPIIQDIIILGRYFLGRFGILPVEPSLIMSIDMAADPKSIVSIVLKSIDPSFTGTTCSTPRYWALEAPDSASMTNAHSMAMIGAALAGKGALNGTRIISEAALARGLQERGRIPDFYYGGLAKPAWTAAGWSVLDDGYSKINGEGPWYGTGGFGGSVNAFNQKYNASIAFSMNGMLSSVDYRYVALTDALMASLKKLGK